MQQNFVSITRTNNIDDPAEVKAALYQLLSRLQPVLHFRPGAQIIIKLNLCLIKGSETGATSDPFITRYLVEWLLEHCDPAEIILAESDATHLSADLAFKLLGWDQYFRDTPRTRLLNLSTDDRVTVPINGQHFTSLEMSQTYMTADYLISFAKLKTHTQERITCTMKNLFGSWPEKVKIIYHPVLDKVIHDLTKVRVPDLCLVDGIIAHEGAGPVDGLPKPLGIFIGGTDPVATDHTCARVMGVNPKQVPHLRLAIKNGLGSTNYTVSGHSVDDVRTNFEFIPTWVRTWYSVKHYLVQA